MPQRDEVIAAAVQAGKFPPERAGYYCALWDQDPEQAEQLIDALVAVPLAARREQPTAIASPVTDDAYDPAWLPEVKSQGPRPVTFEDAATKRQATGQADA